MGAVIIFEAADRRSFAIIAVISSRNNIVDQILVLFRPKLLRHLGEQSLEKILFLEFLPCLLLTL